MSLGVVGLVINRLTKKEIIQLPILLNQIEIKENDNWSWQDEMSIEFLTEYWKRDAKFYTENLAEKEIHTSPIIWGNRTWNIHFFHEQLISISIDRNWSSFYESEELRTNIKATIQPIRQLLKAEEILFTYDLSTHIDEEELNHTEFKTLEELEKFLIKNEFKIIK